jgi:hypothetical protein
MPWPPQCAKKEPHEGWRGWRSREVPSSWNSRKGLLLYIVIDVKADLVQLCQKKTAWELVQVLMSKSMSRVGGLLGAPEDSPSLLDHC